LQAFKPARGMPRKLPAFNPACKHKLAGVQAGARHAAQAAGFQSGLQA